VPDLIDAAVDRQAGVVDPGVDAAEAFERRRGKLPNLVVDADIDLHRDGLAALLVDVADDLVERLLAARAPAPA
jgi:hypothetical protein